MTLAHCSSRSYYLVYGADGTQLFSPKTKSADGNYWFTIDQYRPSSTIEWTARVSAATEPHGIFARGTSLTIKDAERDATMACRLHFLNTLDSIRLAQKA